MDDQVDFRVKLIEGGRPPSAVHCMKLTRRGTRWQFAASADGSARVLNGGRANL